MTRPTDWYVLDLDGDPTPGDPLEVRALARTFLSFAADIADARTRVAALAGAGAVSTWVGDSGNTFRDEIGSFPKDLDKLHTSYRLAGDALNAYAPRLDSAQSGADRALAQGREAHARLAAATSALTSARTGLDTSGRVQTAATTAPQPDPDQVRAAIRDAAAARSAVTTAQNRVGTEQAGLDAARALALQARSAREDAEQTCASAIHAASDAGIHNKHWWQKAADFVADHWGDVVAVCKVIVAVLGIVVLIIGGPLAWVVVAAALVVFADTLAKALNGQASWWDVGLAALACIPVTDGLTSLTSLKSLWEAGGLLRVGAAGLDGLRGGLTGLADGVRGLGAATKVITKGLPDALGDLVRVRQLADGLGGTYPVLGLDAAGLRTMMSEAADAFRGSGSAAHDITSDVGPWRIGDNNPLDIVPDNASFKTLTPHSSGGAQEGVEYKWYDADGQRITLRAHGPDGTAPPGSNAASGHTYRVRVGSKYQDVDGNLYHQNSHNPASPYYNPDAANKTHIPWPDGAPRPY